MPLLWIEDVKKSQAVAEPENANYLCLLPPAVAGVWKSAKDLKASQIPGGILQKQKKKLELDWRAVFRANPVANYETYVYYWLIVNTRSFYYELPGAKKAVAREDRMVLCPFVDFFNHADHGVSASLQSGQLRTDEQCDVTFDEDGFMVTSDRSYGIA